MEWFFAIFEILKKIWNRKETGDKLKNEINEEIKETIKKPSVSSDIRDQRQKTLEKMEKYFNE